MGFTHAMSQFATRCQEKTRNPEHGANAKALGRKFDAILTHAVAQLATSNSRKFYYHGMILLNLMLFFRSNLSSTVGIEIHEF